MSYSFSHILKFVHVFDFFSFIQRLKLFSLQLDMKCYFKEADINNVFYRFLHIYVSLFLFVSLYLLQNTPHICIFIIFLSSDAYIWEEKKVMVLFRITSSYISHYDELFEGDTFEWIIINSRILNSIERQGSLLLIHVITQCRNKFKFTSVLLKISREVISDNGYKTILSFSPSVFAISTRCRLPYVGGWISIHPRRGAEPSLKLFRNEISRGTKRDYGRERLFARVVPARVAAVSYIKLSVADVAGAYDTFGLVKRLYFSRQDRALSPRLRE